MTELQILNAVKNNGGSIGYIDLLNLGKTESEWSIAADEVLIRKLLSEKFLSGQTEPYSSISITKTGCARCQELITQENDKQEAKLRAVEEQFRLQRELSGKEAQEKTKQRNERVFEIFLVLLSALLSNIDRIPTLVSRFLMWLRSVL